MLKSAILLIGLVASSAAFAFSDYNGTYSGRGTWKDNAGAFHRWSSNLTLRPVDGGYLYHENLKIHSNQGTQTVTIDYMFRFNDHGFFDVLIEDKVIGHGYCFRNVCHYEGNAGHSEGNAEGTHFEQTMHLTRRDINIVGSMRGGDNSLVWMGRFTNR